ncbi:hypothetical protein IW261DRAFT_1644391 [Armillaria novae-zelandiae]|uniref:Uncharacterized protein n=1 Tax=Armillaria novae-zelandiae TaxID=153914 RepID=A0AA39U1R3_9AGAR|nr:hypothetical protein IW261DRAFT_1644391 [Armillaria novae-zelandiae]
MAVMILIRAPPPPPHLLMEPFTPRKKPLTKSPGDHEALQNHANPLLPSAWVDGAEMSCTPAQNDVTKQASWITGRTPYSRGANSIQIVVSSKSVGSVEEYLQEDHCVFMRFDTFLQTILLLPRNWGTEYKSAIDEFLTDKEFAQLLDAYLTKANVLSVDYDCEKRLYRPHAKLHNRAIDLLKTSPKTTASDSDIVHFGPLAVRGYARAEAKELAGEGKMLRVLDHLPEILHSQDFHFDQEDCP